MVKTQIPIEINGKNLPVYCPDSSMKKWSSHPRIFLNIDDNGKAQCPYCGTQYQVKLDTGKYTNTR